MNRWLRLLLWLLAAGVIVVVLAMATFGALLLWMHFNPIRLG